MDIFNQNQSYTASEARDRLYSLIKLASKSLQSFEINLRGEEPVLLINKAELEAWQETFDILSQREEMASIRKARKQKRNIPHEKMLKLIGLKNAA